MADDILIGLAQGVKELESSKDSEFFDKFSSFVDAHKRATESYAIWDDCLNDFNSSTKIQKSLLPQAQALAKQDKRRWDAMIEKSKELYNLTGDNFRKAVFKIFKTVFGRVRARNVQICKLEKAKWDVCLGANGFSKRYNVHAKPIDWIDDMWAIVEEQDRIIQALRMKKYNDMADKFELFCSKLPNRNAFDSGKIQIALKNEVLIDNTDKEDVPKMCKKLLFDCETVQLVKSKSDYDDDFRSVRDLHIRNLREDEAFIYYQVHNQLADIETEFFKVAAPLIKESAEAIEKLEDAFGKELLFAEL